MIIFSPFLAIWFNSPNIISFTKGFAIANKTSAAFVQKLMTLDAF